MPSYRFFSSNSLLEKEIFFLDEQESHHLLQVMRKKKGERIEVINGKGIFATCQFIDIEKKRASCQVLKRTYFPPLPPSLSLGQALPRFQKLDLIVEKACELGAHQIHLFPSQLSEKATISEHQQKRLHLILISAAKQSGRFWLPELFIHPDLSFLKEVKGLKFFGEPNQKVKPLKAYQTKLEETKSAFFLIGPEKGFTQKEIDLFKQLEFLGVGLTPFTLRTETAAIAALTLLSHILLT